MPVGKITICWVEVKDHSSWLMVDSKNTTRELVIPIAIGTQTLNFLSSNQMR